MDDYNLTFSICPNLDPADKLLTLLYCEDRKNPHRHPGAQVVMAKSDREPSWCIRVGVAAGFLRTESFPSPAKGGIRTEGQDECQPAGGGENRIWSKELFYTSQSRRSPWQSLIANPLDTAGWRLKTSQIFVKHLICPFGSIGSQMTFGMHDLQNWQG